MATKQANAAQKQWMRDISDWAQDNMGTLYGDGFRDVEHPFQRHHVLGRSAKHNKISIGHWFVIPVPFELHDVSSNHPLNVTHHKHKFTEKYGRQSHIFDLMVKYMDGDGYITPDLDICSAIMDTNA